MVILGRSLTWLKPSIRGNITGVGVCKSSNETVTATGNVTVDTVILILQQVLGIPLVIAGNQSILRRQRGRMQSVPVQHRAGLTITLQTQGHIGRIGTVRKLRPQLLRIAVKSLARTVNTHTRELRSRDRQVTGGQVLRCLTHSLQSALHLGVKGVLMES